MAIRAGDDECCAPVERRLSLFRHGRELRKLSVSKSGSFVLSECEQRVVLYLSSYEGQISWGPVQQSICVDRYGDTLWSSLIVVELVHTVKGPRSKE